jgi:hypothetical protein
MVLIWTNDVNRLVPTLEPILNERRWFALAWLGR